MTTTGHHTRQRALGRGATKLSGRAALRRRIPLLVAVGGLTLAACGGSSGDGGTIGSGTGVPGDGSDGVEISLPAPDAGDETAVGGDDQTGDDSVATGDGQVGDDGADQGTDIQAEPAAPADGTDDGLTTEQWAALIIIAVAVIALIAGVTAIASRRSSDRRQQQTQTQQRHTNIIGGCRWAHDQAALTVLSTNDSAMLRSTWTTIERQLLDLESSIAAAQTTADGGVDPSLAEAGRAVSALRGALAADVALRSGSTTPAPDLITQSRQTVLDRNGELETATAHLNATHV